MPDEVTIVTIDLEVPTFDPAWIVSPKALLITIHDHHISGSGYSITLPSNDA